MTKWETSTNPNWDWYVVEERGGAVIAEMVGGNPETRKRNAEAIVESHNHVCGLPDSIGEALNMGDGAYRP
jgi:hypothetical protein